MTQFYKCSTCTMYHRVGFVSGRDCYWESQPGRKPEWVEPAGQWVWGTLPQGATVVAAPVTAPQPPKAPAPAVTPRSRPPGHPRPRQTYTLHKRRRQGQPQGEPRRQLFWAQLRANQAKASTVDGTPDHKFKHCGGRAFRGDISTTVSTGPYKAVMSEPWGGLPGALGRQLKSYILKRELRLKDGSTALQDIAKGSAITEHWHFEGRVERWQLRDVLAFWATPDMSEVEVVIERRFQAPGHVCDGAIDMKGDPPPQKPGPKTASTMTAAERQAKKRAEDRGEMFVLGEYRRKREAKIRNRKGKRR
jgi:hypothetical protein